MTDQDIGGDRKNWWYCPKTKKCAVSFRDCDMSAKMRALSSEEFHNATTILEYPISVETRANKKSVTGMVHGKSVSTEVSIKVLEDANAGFQALSNKQVGGLLSIAGTAVDVETSQVIFSVPEEMYPNFCMHTMSPRVMKDNSIQAIEIELCDGGRAFTKAPKGSTNPLESTVSLANLRYVRREVKGAIKIQPFGRWKNAPGTDPYYHILDMGDGSKLCVFAGTLVTTWSGGQSSVIMKSLPPGCTGGYQKEGFLAVVMVIVNGERQWVEQGTIAFHLSLQGTELKLQTTRRDLAGKKVSVSLDGITLASGGQLSKCNNQQSNIQQRLGELQSTHTAPVGTFGPGSSASYSAAPVGTFAQDSSASDVAPVDTFAQDYSAPVGTFGPGATSSSSAPVGTFAQDYSAPVDTFGPDATASRSDPTPGNPADPSIPSSYHTPESASTSSGHRDSLISDLGKIMKKPVDRNDRQTKPDHNPNPGSQQHQVYTLERQL